MGNTLNGWEKVEEALKASVGTEVKKINQRSRILSWGRGGREERSVQRRAGIVVSSFAEHLRNENI